MGRKTPLYALHRELGARLVDFGGWDMPVQYSSQIGEHHAVRRAAGVFDVSHMCVIDLKGERVRAFLQYLLANDVGKLKTPGKALYSCLLNESGGILDDLIAYYLSESWFRLVVNAGTRDADLAWIRRHARGLRRRGHRARGPGDARGAGPGGARQGGAAAARRRRPPRRWRSRFSWGASSARGSWRAPATPARTASRSCCRPRMRCRRGAASIPWASPPAGSARATRCAWRRA